MFKVNYRWFVNFSHLTEYFYSLVAKKVQVRMMSAASQERVKHEPLVRHFDQNLLMNISTNQWKEGGERHIHVRRE